MKVKLKKGWFGPDGSRYRPGEHQFPQSWKDKLPSSAVVLADEEQPVEAEKPVVKKPA